MLPQFIYYVLSFFLELNAASRYEATVAAQNDEDWSRHGPTFHFSTFGAGD